MFPSDIISFLLLTTDFCLCSPRQILFNGNHLNDPPSPKTHTVYYPFYYLKDNFNEIPTNLGTLIVPFFFQISLPALAAILENPSLANSMCMQV
jgi:hypothetical protein